MTSRPLAQRRRRFDDVLDAARFRPRGLFLLGSNVWILVAVLVILVAVYLYVNRNR